MAEIRPPSQQERDLMRAKIYAAIYDATKDDGKFIDEQGRPTVEYWAAARRIVEPLMREWAENRKNPLKKGRNFRLS